MAFAAQSGHSRRMPNLPTRRDLAHWGSAALVFGVSLLAGRYAAEGMTLLQTNKPAGWQTVPHVHVHVLPRHSGDGADLVWPRKDPPLAELQALAARLVNAVSASR